VLFQPSFTVLVFYRSPYTFTRWRSTLLVQRILLRVLCLQHALLHEMEAPGHLGAVSSHDVRNSVPLLLARHYETELYSFVPQVRRCFNSLRSITGILDFFPKTVASFILIRAHFRSTDVLAD